MRGPEEVGASAGQGALGGHTLQNLQGTDGWVHRVKRSNTVYSHFVCGAELCVAVVLCVLRDVGVCRFVRLCDLCGLGLRSVPTMG